MEPEPSEEAIEWQARRIVAAFEMNDWELAAVADSVRVFGAYTEDWVLEWCLDGLQICNLAFGNRDHLTSFSIPPWAASPNFESSLCDDLMARGLYRLGFDNPFILAHLPELSAHEKLELRKTMPHEFWPPKWREEEVGYE